MYGNDSDKMIGEILTNVDIGDSEEGVLFTCQSGKQFRMYHSQDCCEWVRIEDQSGDFHKLIGKKLIYVGETNYERGGEVDYGTYTDTEYTFKVDDHTVIVKWHGESNGYYSESVELVELTNGNR